MWCEFPKKNTVKKKKRTKKQCWIERLPVSLFLSCKNDFCFQRNSWGHRQIGCTALLWYYWTLLLIEFAAAGRRSNCFWLFHLCKWARAFWEFSSDWAHLTLSPACEVLSGSVYDWIRVTCTTDMHISRHISRCRRGSICVSYILVMQMTNMSIVMFCQQEVIISVQCFF